MKINSSYTSTVSLQQKIAGQQSTQPAGQRDDAEARLRELIAQKHAEFDRFRPVEELGKHLDLRA